METLFYQDARISQWTDQVVEKLFTVCLLSGPDADSEFRAGRKIVERISQTLENLGIEEKDIEYGVAQLIEQRMPDRRVLKKFPQFEEIFAKMIKEGITSSQDFQEAEKEPQPSGNLKGLAVTETGLNVQSIPEDEDNNCAGRQKDAEEILVQTEKQEPIERTQLVPGTSRKDFLLDKQVDKHGLSGTDKELSQAILSGNNGELAKEAVLSGSPSRTGKGEAGLRGKASRQVQALQTPPGAEALAFVLRQIYPDKPVRWNLTIGHQNFLAQVTNILIRIWEPDNEIEQYKKIEQQGWRMLVLDQQDLKFTHRIERKIRQVNRKQK